MRLRSLPYVVALRLGDVNAIANDKFLGGCPVRHLRQTGGMIHRIFK